MGRYQYNAFGRGNVFWLHLKCYLTGSRDWHDVDSYGMEHHCKKMWSVSDVQNKEISTKLINNLTQLYGYFM